MNLLTMMYTTQQIAQAFGKPLELALEQWNNYLEIAQMELFKEFADGYATGNGAVVSARVDAALAPFKQSDIFTGGTLTHYPSGGGVFGVPCTIFNLTSGLYRLFDAFAIDTAESYPDKVVKIDIVTPDEAGERLNNSITYPTLDYPIMYLDKEGGSTQYVATVMPNGLAKIATNGLLYPITPSLVLSYANNVPSQDNASVDVYFDQPFRIDIIRIILKYLGLSVGNDQVRTFVEQQKINEK